MNARLHHNGRSQGCVGIDIGGTKIEGVLLDATDRVIDVCRMPSHSGESNVVTDIVRVARILSNEALPIGIGIPGQVNCATGQVRNVVNLDIETLELGERVSAIMHAPVHVENDVNAAAVGAAEFVEQVDGNATVVFLNFGTGLAAGLVRGRASRARVQRIHRRNRAPTHRPQRIRMPMRAAWMLGNRGIRRGHGKTLALRKPAHA